MSEGLLASVQLALEAADAAGQHEGDLLADLYVWAGRAALQAADLRAAQNHAQKAAAAASGPEAASAAGALLLAVVAEARAAGTTPEAEIEDLLRQAAASSPRDGLRELARHLRRSGRAAEAADLWRQLIQLGPVDSGIRLELARSLEAAGDDAGARRAYLELTEADPSTRNLVLAASHLKQSSANPGSTGTLKVAILGNATLDLLAAAVAVECHRAGLLPEVLVGGFDQYAQDLLDPAGPLDRFDPDVVILAVHPSRLFPELHRFPFDRPAAERERLIEAGLGRLQALLDGFTGRSRALVLLHNLPAPQHPALGIQDLRDELGQSALFGEANRRLAELVKFRYGTVQIVDEDRVQSQVGKARATDPRAWFSSSLPWTDAMNIALAREYVRYLRPLRGLGRKCVVVDLDNTIWGGVLGEDGPEGIVLGPDPAGAAFLAFQAELETLGKRGILLAACSKNDLEPVLQVLDSHPSMLLRRSHFAALRINWNDKAANLREIATELNIGLDSLVFLDDNPAERARVRAALPEVLTPELPADPALYRTALLHLGVFDSLALTDEDRLRGRLYDQERARRELETEVVSTGSVEDYLAELKIVVELGLATESQLPRVAQLCGKTNQFNLTTRRHSQGDLEAMRSRGERIYALSVRDRFGDCGLVGVAIVRPAATAWHIDDLLLSCRAMGRGVETVLLGRVLADAGLAGVSAVQGTFIPTPKNAPARPVYGVHGFVLTEVDGEAERWAFDLAQGIPPAPRWIEIRAAAELVSA